MALLFISNRGTAAEEDSGSRDRTTTVSCLAGCRVVTVSGPDHSNGCGSHTDNLPATYLAALALLELAIHLHLAGGNHCLGCAAAAGKPGRLQQCIERNEFTPQLKIGLFCHCYSRKRKSWVERDRS